MNIHRKTANLCYAVVVIVGVLFVITAFSCMMQMARSADFDSEVRSAAKEHPLLLFMEKHGTSALIAELAVLGAATLGALWSDDVGRRKTRREREITSEPMDTNSRQ
ncbi:MAG: hypothetical protein ACC628_26865 [Pirellulaceae bacterium]